MSRTRNLIVRPHDGYGWHANRPPTIQVAAIRNGPYTQPRIRAIRALPARVFAGSSRLSRGVLLGVVDPGRRRDP